MKYLPDGLPHPLDKSNGGSGNEIGSQVARRLYVKIS